MTTPPHLPSIALEGQLRFSILAQPDETTCGPTCLHAVYRYYNDDIELERVVAEIQTLEGGGTLAVFLANHALRRGYRAVIYTYNLQVFDPTWFGRETQELKRCLAAQARIKPDPRLQRATSAYLEFLDLGGEIRFEDLSSSLLRKYLSRSVPVLTGLSATYLYRTPREFGPKTDYDDIRGVPSGHFVVLCGYDREERRVAVADPLRPNPFSEKQIYVIAMNRVVAAVLLGVLTYDANLLVIEPLKAIKGKAHARPPRG